MSLHFIQRRANDPRAGLADIKRRAARDLLDTGAQRATRRVKTAPVGIGVGGDKAGAVGHKECRLVHHFPVIGTRFTDDNEIRVNVSNGETGFV
ncbi:hypothetical protein D3C75_965490 [compost metagenome]